MRLAAAISIRRDGAELFASDPHWKDLLHDYEYFHAETGEGLGASQIDEWRGKARLRSSCGLRSG